MPATRKILGEITLEDNSVSQLIGYDATTQKSEGYSFAGNAGLVASVNATEDGIDFIAVAGTGTVTSVGLGVPTGLTVSGTPVTTSGTITIGLDTDRVIPTNTALAAKVNDNGDILNGAYDRTLTTLTDAASIALNLASNNFYQVTLGGNRTLANPTNKPAAGNRQVIILEVVQDGVGGRTLSFGGDYVLSVTPVLNSAANAVTHITLIATDNLIYVVGYA